LYGGVDELTAIETLNGSPASFRESAPEVATVAKVPEAVYVMIGAVAAPKHPANAIVIVNILTDFISSTLFVFVDVSRL